MSTKTWLIIVLVLFATIVAVTTFLFARSASRPTPIVEQTSTPEVEETPEKEWQAPAPLSSRVMVTSPQKDQAVGHTFVVAGTAPGPWFFEAQFPMQVRDMEGNVIGRALATAQGEWMTEQQVTFTATMNIDSTYSGPAKLILIKDNPSGMPEHDDAVEIPITID